MDFIKKMLVHAEEFMGEGDILFWRGEAQRLGIIPPDLTDSEIDLWLAQSDYANQF